MRRRDFISGVLLPILAPAASAQAPIKTRRIAIVSGSAGANFERVTAMSGVKAFSAFLRELEVLGYSEGKNLVVERRYGESRPERYAALAREVVALDPEVIVATSNTLVEAFVPVTSKIPIVAFVNDPVGYGLTKNLARPGGNITGVSGDGGSGIWRKYLEVLKSIKPSIAKVGLLTHQARWETSGPRTLRETAAQMKLTVPGLSLEGFGEADYRRVIEGYVQQDVRAVVVPPLPENFANRRFIVDLLNPARLIAVYGALEYVPEGGLIAYAPDFDVLYRDMAHTADRILKGAEPGEIPFVQPTKWLTVINLKTAKALGVEIPSALLVAADEVIEE